MKKIGLFLALALAMVLSACNGASTGPLNDEQLRAVEIGCASASAALKTLAIANDAGKLTPATQTAVLSAAGRVAPICGAPEPPTLDSLQQQAFQQAVGVLVARAAESSPGD
jgi:hypothetical protein